MKKRLLSSLRSVAGFTMIELLVVIAIIGVLAVAMLSAINPLEQINRGRDTRDRSDASELLGGMERYYASHEEWPFTVTTTGTNPVIITDATTPDNVGTIANILLTAEEVKAGFESRMDASDKFTIRYMPDAASDIKMYVCFTPTSQQFKDEAVKNCGAQETLLKSIGACVADTDYSDATADAYSTELICLP